MSDGPEPIYRRVLLKLSGEALVGKDAHPIDPTVLDRMASDISDVRHSDCDCHWWW